MKHSEGEDKVLIVGHDEVEQLLPMGECIEAMQEMFRTLGEGKAILPLRTVMLHPDGKGALALMPAYLGATNPVVGGKVITVFPGNLGTPYESHQGCVLLFECGNGRLLSIIDASAVTAIRTAAASAVATRYLARRDATNLAILGSGVQAGTHLSAMANVRGLKSVKVWSRNRDHAELFVRKHEKEYSSDMAIELADSVREAVKDADIVCTTTGSPTPLLEGVSLRSGVHINAVGASRPEFRELDSEAVGRCRIYTDRVESLQNEAGDYLIPLREGVIRDGQLVGEIGDLVIGKIQGRRSDDELTLFKSLGIATEDLASVSLIYQKALGTNLGTWINFGGSKEG